MAGAAAGPPLRGTRRPRTVASEVGAQVPGGAFELVDQDREVERETLFTYRGREYTIPVSFGIEQGLEYTHLSRVRDLGYAVDWAMELALGTEGYAALRAVRGLDPKVLESMMHLITRRLLSAGADETGPKA